MLSERRNIWHSSPLCLLLLQLRFHMLLQLLLLLLLHDCLPPHSWAGCIIPRCHRMLPCIQLSQRLKQTHTNTHTLVQRAHVCVLYGDLHQAATTVNNVFMSCAQQNHRTQQPLVTGQSPQQTRSLHTLSSVLLWPRMAVVTHCVGIYMTVQLQHKRHNCRAAARHLLTLACGPQHTQYCMLTQSVLKHLLQVKGPQCRQVPYIWCAKQVYLATCCYGYEGGPTLEG